MLRGFVRPVSTLESGRSGAPDARIWRDDAPKVAVRGFWHGIGRADPGRRQFLMGPCSLGGSTRSSPSAGGFILSRPRARGRTSGASPLSDPIALDGPRGVPASGFDGLFLSAIHHRRDRRGQLRRQAGRGPCRPRWLDGGLRWRAATGRGGRTAGSRPAQGDRGQASRSEPRSGHGVASLDATAGSSLETGQTRQQAREATDRITRQLN
jgi:hypothetical protein